MKPFEHYLRLLLELHVLMHNEKGDSVHADYIRDQMDYAWWDLEEKEMKILELVSEALYNNKCPRSSKEECLASNEDVAGSSPAGGANSGT